MKKFTDEAREYCKAAISLMTREELVESLENIGVACYDDEPIEDFIDSYVDSVEAGDIEFDFSYQAANQYPHHVKMLRYNIDEVYSP